MSNTFKFLNSNTDKKDSAQSLLDTYTDRYTPKQLDRLNSNGGPSVVNNDQYQNVVTNQSAIDDFNSRDKRRGIAKGGDLDHYGNMYESGQWGTGEKSADDLAKEYGLERSLTRTSKQKGDVDAGHIWGKDASGKDVYIGSTTTDLALGSNQSLIDSHSTQLYDEINHNEEGTNLSSMGDIQGALLAEWDGGGKSQAPEAITEKVKIEYSPEIQQAKERVAMYENDSLSGKISDDIYRVEELAEQDQKYDFDSAKQAAGIIAIKNDDKSQEASNLLENKKSDIKKKYIFKT